MLQQFGDGYGMCDFSTCSNYHLRELLHARLSKAAQIYLPETQLPEMLIDRSLRDYSWESIE